MLRFLKVAWIITELASVPIAGYLFDPGGQPSDWKIVRLGVLPASLSNEDANPRTFRFRIPRASELRDLVPRRNKPSGYQEVRSISVRCRHLAA